MVTIAVIRIPHPTPPPRRGTAIVPPGVCRFSLPCLLLQVFGFGLLIASDAGLADERSSISPDEVEKAISDPFLYGALLNRFRAASDDELRILQDSKDRNIAIVAAWEIFVRRSAVVDSRGEYRITSLGARQFVTTCEDHLKVKMPNWFEGVLQTGSSPDRDCFYFTQLVKNPTRSIAKGYATLQGTDATISEGEVVLKSKEVQLRIPTEKLLPPLRSHDYGLAFATRPGCFDVAVHDGAILRDYPFNSFKPDGAVLWSNTVWTCIDSRPYSGDGYFHWATVIEGDDLVHVIGIGATGAYIESFDVGTGREKLRFLSTFVQDVN